MTTFLVADDHPAVLQAVTQVLVEAGFELVATATRGDDALARLRETQPEVAILDAHMPGFTGIEIAREARAEASTTAIVFYMAADDPGLLEAAVELGVRGFVLKDAPIHDLVHAVRTVADGGSYVDGSLAGNLLREAATANLPELTKREREVLSGLANGESYEEIGKRLSISPATARVHLQKAMVRLDASTKTQAVAAALRLSLID